MDLADRAGMGFVCVQSRGFTWPGGRRLHPGQDRPQGRRAHRQVGGPRPCCAGCTPSSPAASRSTPRLPLASSAPTNPCSTLRPDRAPTRPGAAWRDNRIDHPRPAGRARCRPAHVEEIVAVRVRAAAIVTNGSRLPGGGPSSHAARTSHRLYPVRLYVPRGFHLRPGAGAAAVRALPGDHAVISRRVSSARDRHFPHARGAGRCGGICLVPTRSRRHRAVEPRFGCRPGGRGGAVLSRSAREQRLGEPRCAWHHDSQGRGIRGRSRLVRQRRGNSGGQLPRPGAKPRNAVGDAPAGRLLRPIRPSLARGRQVTAASSLISPPTAWDTPQQQDHNAPRQRTPTISQRHHAMVLRLTAVRRPLHPPAPRRTRRGYEAQPPHQGAMRQGRS
jgi:hypothetical protein